MRLGKRERAAKRERLKLAGERLVRMVAEVPQVWGHVLGPKPISAKGTGPGYRWPIAAKCRLNPQRRTLVTRKQGLLDSLANMKPTYSRFIPKEGSVSHRKEYLEANILLEG